MGQSSARLEAAHPALFLMKGRSASELLVGHALSARAPSLVVLSLVVGGCVVQCVGVAHG